VGGVAAGFLAMLFAGQFPDVCPLVLSELKQVIERLESDAGRVFSEL
jgi:cytochrome oxidase Cu insertion factor (SCO1/SenC/PrrC family)